MKHPRPEGTRILAMNPNRNQILLADALRGVLALIDDQVLVRNIEDDHDTVKFLAQGLRITNALVAANDALASANGTSTATRPEGDSK